MSWTIRQAADHLGVSTATIRRILREQVTVKNNALGRPLIDREAMEQIIAILQQRISKE